MRTAASRPRSEASAGQILSVVDDGQGAPRISVEQWKSVAGLRLSMPSIRGLKRCRVPGRGNLDCGTDRTDWKKSNLSVLSTVRM
eukprot:3751620-Rhodomonas_salina.1